MYLHIKKRKKQVEFISMPSNSLANLEIVLNVRTNNLGLKTVRTLQIAIIKCLTARKCRVEDKLKRKSIITIQLGYPNDQNSAKHLPAR